ncbi:serine/threonine-protein kinase [Streptomyces sp. NPDC085995]|uniref:serine/threonine-protein kinase n=1 Tax=Streptomyces sp. NPDC085995 TaxID=3154861 RepID=UPI0034228E5C
MEALRAQDPARIGAYTLLARLGAGGMGQVYLGRSPGGRHVALKVIRDEITEHPAALARFRREVETVRAVRSAYTANLIDASLEAAPYWLATEYVEGPTLSGAVAERGPLPVPTCRGVFAALAEGLAAVHAQGVTHRDLKPQNIILSAQGPQLIDFGIARGVDQTALTDTGFTAGTPGFTAPEVLTRGEVGPAADVFALGATLAYAATGRPPFGVGEPTVVSYRAVHEPIDLAGVEPELAALIEACTAKERGERPGLAEIIERCAVRSALVDDPFYGGLVGRAGAVPPLPQTPAPPVGRPSTPHELPTVGPHPAAGHGYTPTQPAQPAQPGPRSRRTPWLVAVAVGLVVGVGTAAVFLLMPDGNGTGKADAKASARRGTASAGSGGASRASAEPAGPGATSAAPTKQGQDAVPDGPAYVEQTNPSRDYWTADNGSGMGACQLPPEERSEHFQFSVSALGSDAPYTSGKGSIGLRLKYADPKPGESYFVSVAVKPPHEIDSDTGKPFAGLLQANLSLGYTSKPIDLYRHYRSDPDNNWIDLTYPDDFRTYVNGKEYGEAIPVANDPGDWTVLFLHVTGPKNYASISCAGFTAK